MRIVRINGVLNFCRSELVKSKRRNWSEQDNDKSSFFAALHAAAAAKFVSSVEYEQQLNC